MTSSIIRSQATVESQSFRSAINSTAPFWSRCRSSAGYFVVTHLGMPCWVGRTAGEGLKVAFSRWIEAGAPGEHCEWEDVVSGTVRFVAFPDGVPERTLPGRVI